MQDPAPDQDRPSPINGAVQSNAGVIAPPPLIYAVPLIVGLLVNWWHPLPILRSTPARLAGIVCMLLGLIGFPALISFLRAGTSVKPWEASTALVTTGIYRFTRNPMYVGFSLWYLGISLLCNALWPMLALPIVLIVMHQGVIPREEAYLHHRFGDAYAQYRQRVRRWI
jgi:protein-S-isoprenylcysteine O-methyltransferase Ste14